MQDLRTVFDFCFFCFTQPFEVFGYTFSFLDLALAFFAIGFCFWVIRRLTDP